MRNYFAIAFTCVYLILTVGVAKTTHYCMGRLNNSSYFSYEAKKCRCSAYVKQAAPCCKDEHQLIIIDNDQAAGDVTSPQVPEFYELGPVYTEVLYTEPVSSSDHSGSFFTDTSPPVREPLFILHCSFVYYC